MKTRRLSAMAVAMAAAATMAAPAPSTVVSNTGPASVSQPTAPTAREGMTAPVAVRTVSTAAQLIPTPNVPRYMRREAIWLGRPRDRSGNPWGSRRRAR